MQIGGGGSRGGFEKKTQIYTDSAGFAGSAVSWSAVSAVSEVMAQCSAPVLRFAPVLRSGALLLRSGNKIEIGILIS